VTVAADPASAPDVMTEALSLVEGARERGVPLKLVGGLAVRYLTPDYPPRTRARQDLDLASVSRTRPQLTEFLIGLGHEPDKRFNALYGHKQLFFSSPEGRAIDVLIDRMEMCHELVFSERIDRHPVTLDVTDLLLTKLQIFELNEKDAQDVLYLLSAFAVADGDEPGAVGLDRVAAVVADDWGWWRTTTMNMDRIRDLALGEGAHAVPAGAAYDPVAQLSTLRRAADETPKTRRWRLRAKIGDRRRWYRVPDEDSHD
jgi:hypothetical protein